MPSPFYKNKLREGGRVRQLTDVPIENKKPYLTYGMFKLGINITVTKRRLIKASNSPPSGGEFTSLIVPLFDLRLYRYCDT